MLKLYYRALGANSVIIIIVNDANQVVNVGIFTRTSNLLDNVTGDEIFLAIINTNFNAFPANWTKVIDFKNGFTPNTNDIIRIANAKIQQITASSILAEYSA